MSHVTCHLAGAAAGHVSPEHRDALQRLRPPHVQAGPQPVHRGRDEVCGVNMIYYVDMISRVVL